MEWYSLHLVNKRFFSFVKPLGLDKKFGMHTRFLFSKNVEFIKQTLAVFSIPSLPNCVY